MSSSHGEIARPSMALSCLAVADRAVLQPVIGGGAADYAPGAGREHLWPAAAIFFFRAEETAIITTV